MLQDEAVRILETAARERLAELGEGRDAGNGTSLTAAAATMVAIDAAQARVDVQAVAALHDEDVTDALDAAWTLLNCKDPAPATLPFGTEARSSWRGSVTLAGAYFTLVEGHPGLMREESAPAMCGGQNLDITLSILANHVRRRDCRRIGLPVAIVMEGNVQTVLLRFAPSEEAGGVTLEYLLGSRPIGWRTRDELSDIARAVAASMAAFWRDRAVIAARAEEVRTCIQGLIDEAGPAAEGVAIERIAISQFPNDSLLKTGFDVDVKMLDDAHRFGTSRVFATPGERFGFGMGCPVAMHMRRQADLAAGEPALIDDLAAAIAMAAPEGAPAVLTRLSTQLGTNVSLPFGVGRALGARLYWTNGMIAADVFGDERLEHGGNTITIRGSELPDIVIETLPGRRLDDVIQLPFAAPFTLVYVEQRNGRLKLLFNTETRRVDPAAGTIAVEAFKL